MSDPGPVESEQVWLTGNELARALGLRSSASLRPLPVYAARRGWPTREDPTWDRSGSKRLQVLVPTSYIAAQSQEGAGEPVKSSRKAVAKKPAAPLDRVTTAALATVHPVNVEARPAVPVQSDRAETPPVAVPVAATKPAASLWVLLAGVVVALVLVAIAAREVGSGSAGDVVSSGDPVPVPGRVMLAGARIARA